MPENRQARGKARRHQGPPNAGAPSGPPRSQDRGGPPPFRLGRSSPPKVSIRPQANIHLLLDSPGRAPAAPQCASGSSAALGCGSAPPGALPARGRLRPCGAGAASVMALWHPRHFSHGPVAPRHTSDVALWHTGAPLLALWAPGPERNWPCGTRGDNRAGLVVTEAITRPPLCHSSQILPLCRSRPEPASRREPELAGLARFRPAPSVER